MEVNKMDGNTRDVTLDTIDELKQIFPEVVTDGKVDLDKLRTILGEEVEEGEERYSFTWPGKRDAIKLAISRNTGTLRPDKENSKDCDTTKNLFIEGDNLEVLRVLQNTYRGKVKMIYIDPPYNTGGDFVYKDNFVDNIQNYKEHAGLQGQSNADTSGRYHTNWVNMMYPRLRLAKNLLTDDGVIFISIDDNEVHNLRKICDEIFGEENFVAQLVWKKKYTGGKHTKGYVDLHEYVLVYSKRSESLSVIEITRPEDEKDKFVEVDEFINERGKFYVRPLKSNLELRQTLIYPVTAPDGSILETQWLVAKATLDILLSEKRAEFRKKRDGTYQLYRKYYEKDGGGMVKPPSLIEEYPNTEGKEEMKQLFPVDEGRDTIFYTVKPIGLIKHLMLPFLGKDEVILDFFAGSATTAHAVITRNAEDNGNRRFIMVQLPEITPEDSEARKAGYNTISEIGRERIRRAGEKIKTDYADKLKDRETPLDVGFKAFTLDTTNFREWDSNTENIQDSILEALDTFKDGRDANDALYEVLLKYGVDLSEPVETLSLAGKQVYSLAGNYLLVCLEKKISLETVEEMAKLNPSRVVCYDDGFVDDEVKQNALETLKRAGVEDVRVI